MTRGGVGSMCQVGGRRGMACAVRFSPICIDWFVGQRRCPSSLASPSLLPAVQVRQLVLVGCVTDQCVEHAVRDACDLG